MNKEVVILVLLLFSLGFWNIIFADVSQEDSSYVTPRSVSNIYQSLGNGLSGRGAIVQLRGMSQSWTGLVQFAILESDSNLAGFDIQWNVSYATPVFAVQPDGNGYINQPINVTFNPNKYYAIYFYQDWRIYGSANSSVYPNGSIGSYGSPNSHDDVGELKQAYFHFADVNASNNSFDIDANTTALWRFDETSGSAVIDSTGVNNGTATGTTIVSGEFGNARYFNGSSDYIVVPDNPSLTNFSQLTIEAWVYPTGFDLGCWNQDESIVFKGVGTPPAIIDYDLGIHRNYDAECGSATSFRQLKFSGAFNKGGVASSVWHEPNQWYYVAFTYDGSYLKLYVNGNLEAVSPYTPNLTASTAYPLYINHHTWNYENSSSQRIQGLIDEIRISNVARSAQGITNYYNLATNSNRAPAISILYKSTNCDS